MDKREMLNCKDESKFCPRDGHKIGSPEKSLSYDEISKSIKEAPSTYLPAILIITVEACLDNKIFADNKKLIEVVEKVVQKREV